MLLSIINKIRSRVSGRLFLLVHSFGASFASPPIIRGLWPDIVNEGSMIVGKKCVIRSFRLKPQISVLPNAVLEFGDNAFMNDGINICAAVSIKIGHSVKIGDMVYIYDTDFHAIAPDRAPRRRAIVIGDNVWIGSNSMILAGSQIGNHSVIAAGSVVTGPIPAKCVAAGSPARVISTFDAPDDWVRA